MAKSVKLQALILCETKSDSLFSPVLGMTALNFSVCCIELSQQSTKKKATNICRELD